MTVSEGTVFIKTGVSLHKSTPFYFSILDSVFENSNRKLG